MTMTEKTLPGLYIHVPFCRGKCPYCDFYSALPDEETKALYVKRTEELVSSLGKTFDTVYFGGGTPDTLGHGNIARLLSAADFTENAEITLECNPSGTGGENSTFDFCTVAEAGVNRISLGLQSAVDSERKALGRKAGIKEVLTAIRRINDTGIDNISLDIMLGIPGQTPASLSETLEFCVSSGAKHISAYMLKIEDGTYFSRIKDKLDLPGEEETSDMYLQAVDYLEKHGIMQYEISNFAVPGYESRHNLKYWRCEEYEGIGPSAHSFMSGRRYYYPRSTSDYISGIQPVFDCEGGDEKEYVMLALRLKEGVMFERFRERFSHSLPERFVEYAKFLESKGLAEVSDKSVSLSAKGFLVSNSAILNLTDLL